MKVVVAIFGTSIL